MKTVRIVRQTVANRQTVRVGDVVDLADKEADYLIGLGKAALHTPPVKPQRRTQRRTQENPQ